MPNCCPFFVCDSLVYIVHTSYVDTSDGGLETWFYGARLGSRFRLGLGLTRDYSSETWKKNKMKKEAWKKHSVGGRFRYPQWKNDVFRVEKYWVAVSDFKDLCLGRSGLGLKWSGLVLGLGLEWWGLGLGLDLCLWGRDSITGTYEALPANGEPWKDSIVWKNFG